MISRLSQLNVFNPLNAFADFRRRNTDIVNIFIGLFKVLAQAFDTGIETPDIFNQSSDFLLDYTGLFPHFSIFQHGANSVQSRHESRRGNNPDLGAV